MNKARAYGTFKMIDEELYRTSTYLQWGNSKHSIGAVLMLNPGSSKPINSRTNELTLDPTMQQLEKLIEGAYINKKLEGCLYIYNLFYVKDPKSEHAVKKTELIQNEIKNLPKTLESFSNEKHPWILIGWGCKSNNQLDGMKSIWLKHLDHERITILGKKGDDELTFYHPCPQLVSERPIYIDYVLPQVKKQII